MQHSRLCKYLFILMVLCPNQSAWAKLPAICSALLRSLLPPLYKQTTHHTCGPAALLSWLQSKGINKYTEKQLAKILKTNPRVGTSYKNFVRGLKKMGYKSRFESDLKTSDLEQYLAQGFGVIVDIQLENEGHWALLVSMGPTLVLMDPWFADSGYREITVAEFKRIWFDTFDTVLIKKGAMIIAPKD